MALGGGWGWWPLEPSRLRAAPTLGRVEHSYSLWLLRGPRHPPQLRIRALIGTPAVPTPSMLRVEMRPLGPGPGPGSSSRKAQAETLLGWGAGSALTGLTRGELAILSPACFGAKRTAGTGDPRLHPRGRHVRALGPIQRPHPHPARALRQELSGNLARSCTGTSHPATHTPRFPYSGSGSARRVRVTSAGTAVRDGGRPPEGQRHTFAQQ